MKKIYMIILIVNTAFLFGCSKPSTLESINVIVPNGSTSVAQAFIEYTLKDSNEFTYNVFRVAGPEPLVAAFVNKEFDFIIAPIPLGAKLINTGVDYSFLATITEGNLFLASGNSLDAIESLSGKNIIAFGQNNTPDIVLRSILSKIAFDTPPTMTYVSNTQATLAELTRDPNNIVLISEPFVSMAFNNLETLYLIDLNPVWQEVLELPAFPQAGVFVRNGTSDALIAQFMTLLEESIAFANNYPNELAEQTETLEYPFPKSIIANSIPRSGLVFKDAVTSKVYIEAYLNAILNYNPDLIGNRLPENSFYYGLDNEWKNNFMLYSWL